VHKGSTQTNKRLKRGFKYKGAKKPSVLWSGAPDCSVCHRTVSGAPGPYKVQLATLGFLLALRYNSQNCPLHQRSNDYLAQWSTAMALDKCYSARQSQSAELERTRHWTVHVRWGTGLSGATRGQPPTVKISRTLTVGWRDWRTGLSGAPIDRSLPQRLFGVWGL
jgi:hypothetical protein